MRLRSQRIRAVVDLIQRWFGDVRCAVNDLADQRAGGGDRDQGGVNAASTCERAACR